MSFRIAIAQLNYKVGAFEKNFEKVAGAVASAKQARADLLLLTEMATVGYPPRDLLERRSFVEQNLAQLERIAALSDEQLGIVAGFIDVNPSDTGKKLHNAVALCHRGEVVARRHKALLPTYDVFDEDRYFEPAAAIELIEMKGVKLGVSICEDIWNDKDFWPKLLYHCDPVDQLVEHGAQLLINVSASPFTVGKAALRREIVRQKAKKHGLYLFYANQVGANDELVFDGHSLGVDPTGEVILRARDFEEDFVTYDVPDDALNGRTERPGLAGTLRDVSRSTTEEVHKALILGLRDYTMKCGFKSVVLGLSGGIDSALTAALAATALGPENVLGVSLPSRFSSEGSLTDAELLARNLGIGYRVIPIDPIFQGFLTGLAPAFAGLPLDVTEENLQARIRGSVLMALSNKFGHLVLTTGNKSELAVGYCTLYGDMCGGLAVISDVPKTIVYDIARYINRSAGRDIIPQSSITKAPSAELRPNQTDQDSLPPYELLDRILAGYVEQGRSVDEIARSEKIERPVVAEVVRMINISEYKRRQAAPGIKVTSKAFGFGRRYPIAADFRSIQT